MDARPAAATIERLQPDGAIVFAEARWADLGANWLGLPWSRWGEHAHPDVQIMVFLNSPPDLHARWRSETGRRHEAILPPGSVCVIPGDQPHLIDWHGTTEWASLYLTRGFIDVAARDLAPRNPEPLATAFGVRDPILAALGNALANELRDGAPPGRLYVESLAVVIAAHLRRRFRETGTAIRTPTKLDPGRLRRVLDYIAAHLGQDLALAELAAVAGLSPYHFARAFKQAMSIPPHRYVVERRVARARDLLAGGGWTVARVAAEVGFADQSHLSRHFARLVGVSPGRFARDRKLLPPHGKNLQDVTGRSS